MKIEFTKLFITEYLLKVVVLDSARRARHPCPPVAIPVLVGQPPVVVFNMIQLLSARAHLQCHELVKSSPNYRGSHLCQFCFSVLHRDYVRKLGFYDIEELLENFRLILRGDVDQTSWVIIF